MTTIYNYLRCKQINMHIKPEDYDVWKKYKQFCKDNGMAVSPDGAMFLLETMNKINERIIRAANKMGYPVMELHAEFIDELLTEFDEKIIKDSHNLKNKFFKEQKTSLINKIKSKVVN